MAHTFQFLLEALRVATKQLYNFGVLDTVQQLYGLVVVHKATHRSIQRLCTQRRPNSRTQRVLWRSRLETNAIERQIISLATLEIRLFVLEAKRSIACKVARLFSQNLGVLDKVVPFDRVQLLQVLEQRNTRILVLFTDNLTQRQ